MTVDRHPRLFLESSLARSIEGLLRQLDVRVALSEQVNVYIAGGVAVHLYTGVRTTTDLDAEFSKRFHVPNDVAVAIPDESGEPRIIYLDTNYNSTFGLMHENYQEDAIPVEFDVPHFRVFVLSPVDLVVSKIARLAENDREDILALVAAGLTTADEIEARAEDAITSFVGSHEMLRLNLRDALTIARDAESNRRSTLQRGSRDEPDFCP